MDKLEVFNRASGTWDSDFELITGWSENFVTDKTTDSGKIKLKYKGLEYPNWENGDWCRFIHTANGNVSYHETLLFYTWHLTWSVLLVL